MNKCRVDYFVQCPLVAFILQFTLNVKTPVAGNSFVILSIVQWSEPAVVEALGKGEGYVSGIHRNKHYN